MQLLIEVFFFKFSNYLIAMLCIPATTKFAISVTSDECYGVATNWQLGCLFNCLFRRLTTRTSFKRKKSRISSSTI